MNTLLRDLHFLASTRIDCVGSEITVETKSWLRYPVRLVILTLGAILNPRLFSRKVERHRMFFDAWPNKGTKKPPINAEFLFYLFMSPKDCDALVGDLDERYRLIYKKFGARRANFWYWTQAIRSVSPIVWAWLKKIIMKPAVAAITWASAHHFLKEGSWLTAVAEFCRRVRS